MVTYYSSLKPFKSDEKTCRILLEKERRAHKQRCLLFHTDEEVLDVRLEPIYKPSVQTQNISILNGTCRIRRTIETNELEESGISMPTA